MLSAVRMGIRPARAKSADGLQPGRSRPDQVLLAVLQQAAEGHRDLDLPDVDAARGEPVVHRREAIQVAAVNLGDDRDLERRGGETAEAAAARSWTGRASARRGRGSRRGRRARRRATRRRRRRRRRASGGRLVVDQDAVGDDGDEDPRSARRRARRGQSARTSGSPPVRLTQRGSRRRRAGRRDAGPRPCPARRGASSPRSARSGCSAGCRRR